MLAKLARQESGCTELSRPRKRPSGEGSEKRQREQVEEYKASQDLSSKSVVSLLWCLNGVSVWLG